MEPVRLSASTPLCGFNRPSAAKGASQRIDSKYHPDRGDKEGLRWRWAAKWREEETGSCSTSTLHPADCINKRRNNQRTTETGNGEIGAALLSDQYVAGSWSISSLVERTGNNDQRGGVNKSHLKSDTFFVSEQERRARI